MTEKLDEPHVICRLRIPLRKGQSYLQRVSSEYPDMLVEILSYLPVDRDEVLTDLRLKGNFPMDEVLEKARSSPDVTTLEVLGREVQSIKLRVRSRLSNPSVVRTAIELKLLPDFPDHIRAGDLTTVVISTNEAIGNLYRLLSGRFPGTTIESIRREGLDAMHGSLTPHQTDVFLAAMSSGYWDIPRRVNLSDLAAVLHVSKSTLHETLANVEYKLLHEMEDRFYRPA